MALGIYNAIKAPTPGKANAPGKECLKIRELYYKNHDISDILTFNGNYNGTPYNCLDINQDKAMISKIKSQFELIKKDINSCAFV